MAQTFNAGGTNRLQEVASFSIGPQKQFCSDMPRKLSLPRNIIPLCKLRVLRIGCEFLGRTLLKCRNQAITLSVSRLHPMCLRRSSPKRPAQDQQNFAAENHSADRSTTPMVHANGRNQSGDAERDGHEKPKNRAYPNSQP